MISAIYMRISTDGGGQTFESQKGDLERYCAINAPNAVWFTDKATGKNFNRPSFEKMMGLVRSGHVERIVIWRLDRLGRTASGLTALIDELYRAKVNLVSLKDGLDLETPAGRLMANVLASVANFEREIISERTKAGLEAAYARGYVPRGGKPGRVCDPMRDPRRQQARIMAEAAIAAGGRPNIPQIADVLGVKRNAVYNYLSDVQIDMSLPPSEKKLKALEIIAKAKAEGRRATTAEIANGSGIAVRTAFKFRAEAERKGASE